KLPFVAYSELPMATCPGAGACGVRLDYFDPVAKPTQQTVRGPGGAAVRRTARRHRGWCYSFKAFRYPGAFARQFLNTLANYADREFASARAPGGTGLHPDDYAGRVRAALAGARAADARLWPQYVKGEALRLTRRARAGGADVFLRLFVDGDINHEDSIV